MNTNVYLKFLDTEVAEENTWAAGAVLKCSQHGDICYYSYDAIIPADAIIWAIEEHRGLMHFG